MFRVLPVVLLLVAVVLAGCSAPVSSDPTYGVDESAFPPGVDDGGIENASVLLDAHFDALNRTGYRDRSVYRYVGTDPDHGRVESNETVRLTASPEMATVRYVITDRRTSSNDTESTRWDVWSNRSTAVVRLRCSTNETILSHDEASRRIFLTSLRTPIYGHLNVSGYEIIDVNRSDATTLFTLRARGPNALDRSNVTVTSFEATVVVDSTGRIHRFRSREASLDDEGREQVFSLRYDLREVGVTDVPRPPWSDRALRSEPDDGCPTPNRPA